MDRRTFVKTSLAAGAAVAAASGLALFSSSATAQPATAAPAVPAAAEPTKAGAAVLNLCSQESRLPGRDLKEKVENLVKYGGTGIEMHAGFDPKETLEAIKGTPVKVSAICAADGPYIVPDEGQRRKAVDNAKMLLEKAGQVGSTGVIMVPAFNRVADQLQGREAHKVLVELLKELGEHAVKHKTTMILEPLNRKEAWFLRQCAYAASICQEVNSPGVMMMGDFYHMFFEEPSDRAAFMAGGKYLQHVHVASRTRVLPGQDDRSFVDGFGGLKAIGYRNYVSLECGAKGDKEVEIPKSFALLKRQWEEARA